MSADARPAQADDIVLWTGRIVLATGLVQLVLGFVMAPKGTLNFSVLGVTVGLLILFGSMRVHGIVRWLALFLAGDALFELAAPLVLPPADLVRTVLRLQPAALALALLPSILPGAIVATVCVGLNHPQVRAARASAGRPLARASIPLVLGLLAVLAGGAYMQHMLHGPDAAHASELAAARYGPGYHYYTNFLNYQYGSESRVSATVQVWNDHELLLVPVQWPL